MARMVQLTDEDSEFRCHIIMVLRGNRISASLPISLFRLFALHPPLETEEVGFAS